jgi:hypothetical protein
MHKWYLIAIDNLGYLIFGQIKNLCEVQ